MIELLLIRHGATEWNLAQRLQGQTDISLSDTGRAQARALAPFIAENPPQLVVTSTLSRTHQTAAELGVTVNYADADFSEMALGEWEGRLIPELHSEDPDQYWAWRSGHLTPPGGETFEELCTRVGGALHRVLDRCEEEGLSRALVVCHGGVLRASIQTLIGISPEALMPIDPGSLTIIRVRQTDAGRDPRLQRLNWVPRPL